MHGEAHSSYYDIRELRGTGVAMNGAPIQYHRLVFDTDPNRVLALHALAALGWHAGLGPSPSRFDWTLEGGFTLHPSPAFETQVTVTGDRTLWDPRHIESLGNDRFLLGRLDNLLLTVTLRQDVTLTRKITLQGYLQLFTSFADYGPYFEGTGTRARPLDQNELVAAAPPAMDPSFHTAQLLANLVGRWEYRPGSTLFLVYSRSQSEMPQGRFEATLAAPDLFRGPATDLFLVKWAHWMSL
jgi:hypothetical protein